MEDPFLFSLCSDECNCAFRKHLPHFAIYDGCDDEEFGSLLMNEDVPLGVSGVTEPECSSEFPSESQTVSICMEVDNDIQSLHSSSSTTISYDNDDEEIDDDQNNFKTSSLSASSQIILKSPYLLRYGCSVKRNRLQQRKLKAIAIERISTFISRRRMKMMDTSKVTKTDCITNVVVRDYEWSRFELDLIARLLRGYTIEDPLPNIHFAHRVLSNFITTNNDDHSGDSKNEKTTTTFKASHEDLKRKFEKLYDAIGVAGSGNSSSEGLPLYTSILNSEMSLASDDIL